MDLDPDLVAQLGRRAKRALRGRMRALREALPAAARAARSNSICERVLATEEYRGARSVALFAALPLEVDVTPIDVDARACGKLVYYPFMDPKPGGFRTGFRRVVDLEQMAERDQKFREPPTDAPQAARGDIDLVVVPALAASSAGLRLGYGSGFYDVTLPDVCPPATALVVIYDFQLLAELPAEAHDVPVHTVVTDQRLLRPAG